MRSPTFLFKPSAYKVNKLYTVLPEDGDGDFTINNVPNNGTRVTIQGILENMSLNEPRVDYLGGIPALLMEPVRTNYITSSNDFSAWTLTNVTRTASTGETPYGLDAGATLIEDENISTGSSSSRFVRNFTINDATKEQAFSFFIKFDKCDSAHITMASTSTDINCTFTLDRWASLTASTSTGLVYSGVDRYHNGWLRFKFVGTPNATDTTLQCAIRINDSDTDGDVYTGSFFIFGHQLEEGPSVTSYIPTSGATVTRPYDSVSVTSLMTNDVIGFSYGSVFIDMFHEDLEADQIAHCIRLGSSNGAVQILASTSSPYMIAEADDADDTSVTLSSGRNKVLFNLKGSSVEIWVNGELKGTDTSQSIGLLSQTFAIQGAGAPFRVYEVAMWDTPLNSVESKSMTQ